MNDKTIKISLCSIMAALATVIMIVGGIVPIFTYCSPILASLCILPIMDHYGKTYSILTYIIISILSLLLSPDKEASFFWVFFCWYPILKPYIENKYSSKYIQLIIKLMVFLISFVLMYYLTYVVIGIKEIVESYSVGKALNILFFILIILVMIIYDYMLSIMIPVYKFRIKKYLDKYF